MKYRNYQNPPGIQLRSAEEAEAAIRENKARASARAKRAAATRRRNAFAIDRMVAEAVARDDR